MNTLAIAVAENEIARAREALFSIDSGCSREDWVRIGMAAKAAGLSFDDFHNWSASAGNYSGERDCQTVWNSFDGTGGITAATLYAKARESGWRDSASPFNETRPTPPISAPKKTPQKPAIRPENSKAVRIWESCIAATPAEAYIHRKRGKPDGLRVYPASAQTLHIKGRNLAGYLVVPCWDGDNLQTLQFIPPDKGDKLNLMGCAFGNGYFPVGDIATAQKVFIVEGIGQAWAVTTADPLSAAVVCFGAGRMATVAKVLRDRYPAAALVIVSDRGKETDAAKIAGEVSGQWVAMPAGKLDNYDANDYAAEHGSEALAELLNGANKPLAEPRYKLLNAADIEALPVMQWRIKGVMPTRGMVQIYGPSKAGKSFLAFDMACAIAEGVKWFGYRVYPAPVVYVALEGEAGFKLRAEAWKRKHDRPLPDVLRMVMQPFRINRAEDVFALAEVLPKGAVVFIDTQNRAAPDADENASRDMGLIIEGAKMLQYECDGLVILVAHTGKDASKGPRGHSSQIPAVDAAIEVNRNGDHRTWKADKVKDGRDGAEHAFRLELFELGFDDDGDPLTSCAIDNDDLQPSYKPLTEKQRQGIAAYRIACDEGLGTLDADGNFIGLHLEHWRKAVYRISTNETAEGKKKEFQRIRDSLRNDDLMTVADDVYRITDPATSFREGEFTEAAKRDTGRGRDNIGTCPDH